MGHSLHCQSNSISFRYLIEYSPLNSFLPKFKIGSRIVTDLKIMGGLLKGVSLQFDKEKMRPTASLLKRRFFDSQQRFDGDVFIDVCSGSGSIGLEAWSRGALSVSLIEKNRLNYKNLEKNCEKISRSNYDEVKSRPIFLHKIDGNLVFDHVCEKVSKGSFLGKNNRLIIFFDPPYENHLFYFDFIHHCLRFKAKYRELNFLVIIESCDIKGVPLKDLEKDLGIVDKIYKQGSKYLALFNY